MQILIQIADLSLGTEDSEKLKTKSWWFIVDGGL